MDYLQIVGLIIYKHGHYSVAIVSLSIMLPSLIHNSLDNSKSVQYTYIREIVKISAHGSGDIINTVPLQYTIINISLL